MACSAPGFSGASATLTDKRAWLELIADGHHVHPGAMRICSCCAKDRVVLITDAMQAAGMPDGLFATEHIPPVRHTCRLHGIGNQHHAVLRTAAAYTHGARMNMMTVGNKLQPYSYGFAASCPPAGH